MAQVTIALVKDPFDPIGSREIHFAEPGRTAGEYIQELCPLPTVESAWTVAINGQVCQGYADMVLRADDSLTFCATPKGGGGKNPLAIVASLAVIIAAPYAAGFATSALMGGMVSSGMVGLGTAVSMTSAVKMALTAGFMVAGGLLVNSVFPAKTPSFEGFKQPFEDSRTYGWIPGENPSDTGQALPVIYGKHRVVPPLLAQYIETKGDKQFLNLLYAVAGHKVDDIHSIQINDQPIDNFEKVFIQKSLGIIEQSPFENFDAIRNDFPVSAKFTTDWTVRSIDDCDRWGIGLVAPKGIYYANDKGGLDRIELAIEVQHRKQGESTWQAWLGNEDFEQADDFRSRLSNSMFRTNGHNAAESFFPEATVVRSYQGETFLAEHEVVSAKKGYELVQHQFGSWSVRVSNIIVSGPDLPTEMDNYHFSNPVTLSGKQSSPKRWFFELPDPEDGFGSYEYRFRFRAEPPSGTRYGSDLHVAYHQTIIDEPLEYPHTALLGVRSLATDQLSGQRPRLSCIVERNTVSIPDIGDKPANNPAWVSVHMLTDPLNGGRISVDRIQEAKFEEWADNCSENDLTCNIYFDSAMNLKRALDMIGTLGRGQVVQMGSDFTCITDFPDTAVQHFIFGMGNIESESFTEEWLPMTDRADEIEITFWDADDGWKRKTITVQQDDYDVTDREIKKQTLSLVGCTNRDMAASHGKLLLNKNRYLTLTASWGADIDSLACQVGDVVKVSHDLPQWGYSGRVVEAGPDSIKLDRKVPVNTGVTYAIEIKHGDDTTEIGLFTPDNGGQIDELTLDEPWQEIPEKYDIYTFGVLSRQSKKFKVLNITKDSELRRRLQCIEHIDEVFIDDADIPLQPPSELGDIRGFEAIERWAVSSDGSGRSVIDLSWRLEAQFQVHVFIRLDGETEWEHLASVYDGKYTIDTPLNVNTTYNVAVSTSRPEMGAQTNVTIEGKIWLPSDVTGLRAVTEQTGIRIKWDKADDIDVKEYVLKVGSNYDDGTEIFRGRANNYLWEVTVAAQYEFWIKAVDSQDQESENPGYYQHFVENPGIVNIDSEFIAENVALTWESSEGDFPIESYILSYGPDYETSTVITRSKATAWTAKVNWSGTRRFWIIPVDVAGNEGTPSSTEVTILPPSEVQDIRPQSIHNNVLLRWVEPSSHTLPIASYILEVGDEKETAESLGELYATFATHQELEKGQYRYWIAAKDSAGNVGAWSSVVVSVDAPIGFILRHDDYMDLLAAEVMENLAEVESTGKLIGPVVNETWEEHYLNNSWASPNDQIVAGYPYYLQPSEDQTVWEKTVDYGTVLPGSNISTIIDAEVLAGNPTYQVDLAVSEDGQAWNDYPGMTEIFVSDFRYLKITLTIQNDVNNERLLLIDNIRVVIGVTEKTDYGRAMADANDEGGTLIEFKKDFIDVETINVSVRSTDHAIPVVIFDDVPYPESFRVKVFYYDGERVTREISWEAIGV